MSTGKERPDSDVIASNPDIPEIDPKNKDRIERRISRDAKRDRKEYERQLHKESLHDSGWWSLHFRWKARTPKWLTVANVFKFLALVTGLLTALAAIT